MHRSLTRSLKQHFSIFAFFFAVQSFVMAKPPDPPEVIATIAEDHIDLSVIIPFLPDPSLASPVGVAVGNMKLAAAVAERFKKTADHVSKIVELAEKYSYSDFPKREHILAVIAVESSFRPDARRQGSFGLMQVQARSHQAKLRGRSVLDMETNIEVGAAILHEYYNLVRKNERAAFLAYNAGVGGYRSGKFSPQYYEKIRRELAILARH